MKMKRNDYLYFFLSIPIGIVITDRLFPSEDTPFAMLMVMLLTVLVFQVIEWVLFRIYFVFRKK
jgi:hypothetical protein